MKKAKTLLLFLLLLVLLPHGASAQTLIPQSDSKSVNESVIMYEGFTLSYNHETLCPNWVSWDISPEEAAATANGRTDYFQPDPDLDGRQAQYRDYSANGLALDRGHMAPSADFRWSVTANEESFYLTNICPQNHTLNEGLWLELEQRCRAWAKRYNATVQVVCGPLFGENPATIGQNRVSVPEAFFKAVSIVIDGRRYSIAFIMPNEPLDIQQDIFSYAVSFDELHRRTHLYTGWKDTGSKAASYPWDIPWKKPNKK